MPRRGSSLATCFSLIKFACADDRSVAAACRLTTRMESSKRAMATQPDNWAAVKALFESALEQDPAQRSSFLKEQSQTPPYAPRSSDCSPNTTRREHFSPRRLWVIWPLRRRPLPDPNDFPKGRCWRDDSAYSDFIAAGGMGEVYKAVDTRLGREVAIKIVA